MLNIKKRKKLMAGGKAHTSTPRKSANVIKTVSNYTMLLCALCKKKAAWHNNRFEIRLGVWIQ